MRNDENDTKTIGAVVPKAQVRAISQSARFEPDAETGITVGSRMGRYLVLYRVGSGGMGVVYAAFDPELKRRVALKVVRRLGHRHATAAASRIEAQAMARLVHPNAVTVYDVGVDGDRVFIAMEFVAGVTLEEWLRRKPRSWRDVLGVVTRAGRGLAAAHRSGIVHQDFKPSNVLVAAEDDVRVLDFGLAHLRSDGERTEGPRIEDEEQAGPRGGTPGYMSPEQRAGGDPSPASDQYGFCITLLASLTGRHSEISVDLGRDAAASLWSKPRCARGRIPRWLRRAVERGLSPSPDDRFPTMQDLLDEISLQRRRAGALRAALVVGLLVLAAGGIAVFQGWLHRPTPCAGAERFWVGIWDANRAAQIRTVVRRIDSPAALEAFDFVESALDRYTAEWTHEHEDACRATAVFQDQSQHLLDLRMACLDDRLAGVRALTVLLGEGDLEVVMKAPRTVDQLRPLAPCRERSELMLLTRPPKDSTSVEQVREVVEEQRARLRLGASIDAETLRAAAELARELGYKPLEAQSLLVLGLILDSIEGDSEQAESILEEALWSAVAAGDRALQSDIAIRLINLTSYQLAKPLRSSLWSRFAAAALEPIRSSRPEMVPRLEAALGYRSWAIGDYEQANVHYARAVEMAEREPNLPRSRRITILNNAAMVAPPEQAIAYLDRAIELAEVYGSSSPLLARPLLNLGSNLAAAGRLTESLEKMQRSLELNQAYVGLDHRENAYPMAGVGQVLLRMDRLLDAEKYLNRAIELAVAGYGEQHFLPSAFRIDLAETVLLRGRPEAATRLLDLAEPGFVEQEPNSPTRVTHDIVRSYVLAHAGSHRNALELASRPSATADLHETRYVVMLWLARGRAELGLARHSEAIESLEKALELPGTWSRPRLEAEGKFLLAQALLPSDRETALRLANEALEALEGPNPLRRRLADEIDTWMKDIDRHSST